MRKVDKYKIGQIINFKYCGRISNHEIISGKVMGDDCEDRLLVESIYDGITYPSLSVHVSRIVE